ncbi:hypothetical protein D3C72_1497310 [compost metagenome]
MSRKANASEKLHCELPYSSDAKRKSTLKFDEIGTKSNSRTVALTEFMVIPAAASTFSKSVSPTHAGVFPSLRIEVLGPGALLASPVVKTTPLLIGKFGLVFWK